MKKNIRWFCAAIMFHCNLCCQFIVAFVFFLVELEIKASLFPWLLTSDHTRRSFILLFRLFLSLKKQYLISCYVLLIHETLTVKIMFKNIRRFCAMIITSFSCSIVCLHLFIAWFFYLEDLECYWYSVSISLLTNKLSSKLKSLEKMMFIEQFKYRFHTVDLSATPLLSWFSKVSLFPWLFISGHTSASFILLFRLFLALKKQ